MINFTSQHRLNSAVSCGDKSISHRALILAAVAQGKSVIRNLSLCSDVLATVGCLRALGAQIQLDGTTATVCPIERPNKDVVLNCQNSGTTARLLAGLVAGLGVSATFLGDESLSKRPMLRVLKPLEQMGARYVLGEGFMFKICASKLNGAEIFAEVNSAQVKSAVLLAALFAEGKTSYCETLPTRNHTELLLQQLGAKINVDGQAVSVEKSKPCGFETSIPNDPSSLSFLVALALLDGGKHTFFDVCVNERRTGFFRVLQKSGAKFQFFNKRRVFGEEVSDVCVYASVLSPFEASEREICDAIDEVPVLAALALTVKGTHRFCGVSELLLKESNRIAALQKTAEICGQRALFDGKNLTLTTDGILPQKPDFSSFSDHRIAMSQAVLCLGACGGGSVDCGNFEVSFPEFLQAVGVSPFQLGVVGSNVQNSLSPTLMRHLAKNANVCCKYSKIQLPQDASDEKLVSLLQSLDGANVTMPFKGRVARLLSANYPSVNTVGKGIEPQSTDAYGILCSLQNHGARFQNQPLWIVGAGGAAEACVCLLQKFGAKMQIVNRTQRNAQILTAKYGLENNVENPVGVLSFVPECEFEKRLLLPHSVNFVLVAAYTGQSGIAEQARQRGICLIEGLEMLFHQGAKSFSLWTGKAIQTDYEKFKEELKNEDSFA